MLLAFATSSSLPCASRFRSRIPSRTALYRSRRRLVATMAEPGQKLKIALCQVMVTADKAENIAGARKALQQAAAEGAHIAVLPEIWNGPYDTSRFAEYAEVLPDVPCDADTPLESESLRMVREAAVAGKILVVGGSIAERSGGALYNTCVCVSADGALVAKHRKAHLFDVDVPGGIRFRESDALTAGDGVTVFDAPGLPRIGLGICYDVRFGEYAAAASRRGARLLIYPGAFNMTTGPAHWELLLRARALDNQCFVAACSPARDATASYVAWGHSCVVDPWGAVVGALDEKACVLTTEIDMGRVDVVRQAIPTSLQRRPEMYGGK